MPSSNDIRISKFLSKHLRHAPDEIGLTLQPGGWVEVTALLDGCARRGIRITRADLDRIVRESDKQRYSFDETGTRIRANQGHSVEVDLQLQPVSPPAVLYHGTSAKSLEAILAGGLQPMRRHHVHLSADSETAERVGRRHGKPVVLEVDAAGMAAEGILFYRSENGIWLVDRVPPRFLNTLPG